MNNPQVKRLTAALAAAVLILLAAAFAALPVHAADSYKISFKGGSHGTITVGTENQGVDYEIDAAYQSKLDTTQIRVEPESGYYCTGWSPAIESPVTEKATYVAQYKKIIDEAVYRVNYVDNYGNELATQAVRITNTGVAVTEYALSIDGYAVDQASKSVTVAKEGTEITFTYTSTASPSVTDQVQTVVLPGGNTVVTTGGVTTGTTAAGTTGNAVTAGGNAAAANNGTATDGTTNATDGTNGNVNQQGQTTTVDDNGVPLANQNVSNNDKGSQIPTWGYIAGGLGAALIAGSLIYLIVQKKRKNKSKGI